MDYERTTEKETVTKEKVTETTTTQGATSSSEDSICKVHTNEQLLSLLGLYQNEWIEYNSTVWKHAFAYFIFIFAIIVFPFVCPWSTRDGVSLLNLPTCYLRAFPITGILLSFGLLFVMIGYSIRMDCCRDIWVKTIKQIGGEYTIELLSDAKGLRRFFGTNITKTVAIAMCVLLIVLAILVYTFMPTLVVYMLN